MPSIKKECFCTAIRDGDLDVLNLLLEDEEVREDILECFKGSYTRVIKDGRLDVLNRLLEFPEIHRNITFWHNDVLRCAAENGRLAIVDRLLTFDNVQDRIAINDNKAFYSAYQKGHLSVVLRLLEYPLVQNNIDLRDINSILRPAADGYFEVVNHLLYFFVQNNIIGVRYGEILECASGYGYHQVVNFLLSLPVIQDDAVALHEALSRAAFRGCLKSINYFLVLPIVRQNTAALYDALYQATSNGWGAVIEHFLALDEITANNNEVFRLAVRDGSFRIVSRLLEIPKVVNNIVAENNEAFGWASRNGRLDIANLLLTFPKVANNITANNNQAFRWAAKNGHLDMVKLLLAFPDVLNNIAAENNEAFCWASRNGRLDIANLLLTFPKVANNIAANNNEAFRWAAKNGHLEIIKLLLTFPDVANNIAANNNEAFRWAAKNGHLKIIKLLLTFPDVANNIAAENNEAFRWAAKNGHLKIIKLLLTFPDVTNNIAANNNEAFRWAAKNGHLDIVNLLLAFSVVVENIVANDNYAFRVAYARWHIDVWHRLLDFPAVRAAVLAEDNVDKNLLTIAQDKESSIRDLNLQEQGIVYTLKKLYPDLNINEELNSLNTYLEARLASKGLSLERSEGDELTRQLLDADHQAWRYLARPNHWMSPKARFVEVTEKGRQSSIKDENWHLLALIWHTLNDEKIELLDKDNRELIENNTVLMDDGDVSKAKPASVAGIFSNLRESFVLTLALLDRAHNYDTKEEIDDGDLDKPSCSMGVSKRLVTSMRGLDVADTSDARPIGVNYLAERFKEQLITHEAKGLLPKLKSLSHAELVQLNELLGKLIIDTDGSVLNGLSSILSLESQEVDDFINATKKYYGELRFSALRNLSYQGVIHEDAEAMISCLATIPYIAFSQEIYHFVNQALKESCEANNVDAVMIERPVLLFSDETESSNSRAPALAIEEDFEGLRLESSNESSSLKNIQRKSF